VNPLIFKMTSNIEIEKLLPRFKVLSNRFPQVIAAYLFGSHVYGRPTPLSDIGVGVLLSEDLPDMESFRIEMSLLGEL